MKNISVSKNIFFSILTALWILCASPTFAYDPIQQSAVDTPLLQCEENRNLAHYVGQSIAYAIFVKEGTSFNRYLNNHPTVNWQPIDDTPENLPYISKMFVWNPYGSLWIAPNAYEANQKVPDFFYLSNVKPKDISKVKFARQFSAMYTTKPWLQRTGASAQIYVEISKQQIKSTKAVQSSTNKWFDENNGVHPRNYQITSAYNPAPKDTVCMNFYVASCGDGVLDDPNKQGGNNIDGKQGIQTSQWFISWINTGFVAEKCDSTTETGAACINGTPGCCNATCSGFGWGWFCGDKIINDGQTIEGHGPTYMSWEIEIIETCDLWPWNEDTQEGNISDYKLSACAAYCENNPEPETLPEELG